MDDIAQLKRRTYVQRMSSQRILATGVRSENNNLLFLQVHDDVVDEVSSRRF